MPAQEDLTTHEPPGCSVLHLTIEGVIVIRYQSQLSRQVIERLPEAIYFHPFKTSQVADVLEAACMFRSMHITWTVYSQYMCIGDWHISRECKLIQCAQMEYRPINISRE